MTQEKIQFVNQFQAVVLAPIQNDLIPRKYKNWKSELLSVTIEEILCSLSITPYSNGEFDLKYLCRGDIIEASYRIDGPIEHVEHCLLEISNYLELYSCKGGLLPLNREINHLTTGIKKLLRIINPKQYGEFTNSFI